MRKGEILLPVKQVCMIEALNGPLNNLVFVRCVGSFRMAWTLPPLPCDGRHNAAYNCYCRCAVLSALHLRLQAHEEQPCPSGRAWRRQDGHR
jgi:hypothetical protein